MKEKLKVLKIELKKWNKEVFGNVDSKVKSLESDISGLDTLAEWVGLSEDKVKLRRKKFAELRRALNDKESLIRQKSRVKWLKEGDADTSFFSCLL